MTGLAVLGDDYAIQVREPVRCALVRALVETDEPRVLRMVGAILKRAERIRAIPRGDVTIHFGEAGRRLDVRITEADRE